MNVGFVTVAFKSPGIVRAFLSQFPERAELGYESGQDRIQLVIVDNSPEPDFQLQALARIKPYGATYLFSSGNTGYLNGLASGIKYLTESLGCDWIVCCNPDIRFNPAEFALLLTSLKLNHLSPIIVAPSIRSLATGALQNPYLRTRPALRKLRLLQFLYKSTVASRIYLQLSNLKASLKRPKEELIVDNQLRPIYAAHGSAFVVSSGFLAAIGEVSWPCFLFAEELHLAELVRRVGGAVLYAPALRLEHQEHASISKVSLRNRLVWARQSLAWVTAQYWENHHDVGR